MKKFWSLLLAVAMILFALPLSTVTAVAETVDIDLSEIADADIKLPTLDVPEIIAKIKAPEVKMASLTATGTPDESGTTGDCKWELYGTKLVISGNGKMGDYSYYTVVPWYLKNITEIEIKYGVMHIGNYAFSDCTGLTSLQLPDSVASIGKYSFLNCTGLTSVMLPNSVTSIEFHAFSGCSGLTSFTIPNGATSVDSSAFSDCTNLTIKCCENSSALTYAKNNKIPYAIIQSGISGNCAWALDNGLLTINGKGVMQDYYYESSSYLKQPPWGRDITEVIIGDGITSIGRYAFSSCSKLASVKIGKGVTSIGKYAFSGCSALKSIVIPAGAVSIDDFAFYNCTLLAQISLPDSLEEIGQSAFYQCSALKAVVIPDKVTKISAGTFDSCSSLANVSMSDNVTEIGSYAFYSCLSLTNIYLSANLTSIGLSAFMYCNKLKNIDIPESVTFIDEQAFYSCKVLEKIVIPYGVTSIGYGTFCYCWNIKSITVPDSVTFIGDYAFGTCQYLESIHIPNGVTSIGEYAFSACKGLDGITIPDSVTSIGKCAFNTCNFAEIFIPESVTSIGASAFNKATTIKCIDNSYAKTYVQENGLSYEIVEDFKNIRIVRLPDKIEYELEDEFDNSGMIVFAIRRDGTSKEIADYKISGYNPLTPEIQIITVSYGQFSTTFTVAVGLKFESGDALGDGVIDEKDIDCLLNYLLGDDIPMTSAFDIVNDGVVDVRDVVALRYMLETAGN